MLGLVEMNHDSRMDGSHIIVIPLSADVLNTSGNIDPFEPRHVISHNVAFWEV